MDIEKKLKEICERLERIERLLTKDEPKSTRSLASSERIEEYKEFYECFSEGTDFKTTEELIQEYSKELGEPEFSKVVVGKIFKHFAPANCKKEMGNRTMYALKLSL